MEIVKKLQDPGQTWQTGRLKSNNECDKYMIEACHFPNKRGRTYLQSCKSAKLK